MEGFFPQPHRVDIGPAAPHLSPPARGTPRLCETGQDGTGSLPGGPASSAEVLSEACPCKKAAAVHRVSFKSSVLCTRETEASSAGVLHALRRVRSSFFSALQGALSGSSALLRSRKRSMMFCRQLVASHHAACKAPSRCKGACSSSTVTSCSTFCHSSCVLRSCPEVPQASRTLRSPWRIPSASPLMAQSDVPMTKSREL